MFVYAGCFARNTLVENAFVCVDSIRIDGVRLGPAGHCATTDLNRRVRSHVVAMSPIIQFLASECQRCINSDIDFKQSSAWRSRALTIVVISVIRVLASASRYFIISLIDASFSSR